MHEMNRAFIADPHNQRYGQFMMNYLKVHYPDIVVPEEADCFYDNSKCCNLLVYLENL
jgi:hypothetical protein